MRVSKFRALAASLIAGMMALASPAQASQAQAGYISGVFGTYNGAVLFNTSGVRTAAPACQGPGTAQRFSIDANTLGGQAMLSVFLNAWAQHKQIVVVGAGACNLWGDTESVAFFTIVD